MNFQTTIKLGYLFSIFSEPFERYFVVNGKWIMRATIFFPNTKALNEFLEKISGTDYAYKEVGATATNEKFPHYDNDYSSQIIGKGEEVWQKAKLALKNWQQFPLPWTKIFPNTTPLKKGETVAVLFRLFGLWWKNSTKIVYTFDEANRFGFAYGTLQNHVEMGEEVFWIEKDNEGNVSYHIKAFSKPKFWMAKLTYPMARIYQRKFVKESMATMKNLCQC